MSECYDSSIVPGISRRNLLDSLKHLEQSRANLTEMAQLKPHMEDWASEQLGLLEGTSELLAFLLVSDSQTAHRYH